MPSVGATENILLASIFAEGSTTISNVAQEPEIVDLALFLNAMGADVQGAGSHEIVVNGVPRDSLHGVQYEVMPDRIEAATYMAAAVGTRGKLVIHRMRPEHLGAVTSKLGRPGGHHSARHSHFN